MRDIAIVIALWLCLFIAACKWLDHPHSKEMSAIEKWMIYDSVGAKPCPNNICWWYKDRDNMNIGIDNFPNP